MSEGGIYAKLAEAITEVDWLTKDGTNEFHHYKYTSAEEVYRRLRGPLLNRGLVILPEIATVAQDGDLTLITLHIRIVDSASGESIAVEWAGEGQDKGDKGTYKAATGGMKTFLRHLFMLPTDDDPEADAATDKAPAKQPKGEPKPPSAKQLELIQRLLKPMFAGSTDPAPDQVAAWAETQLTGGKGGTASALIDAMKTDQAAAKVGVETRVREWAPKADALEADWTGL